MQWDAVDRSSNFHAFWNETNMPGAFNTNVILHVIMQILRCHLQNIGLTFNAGNGIGFDI